MPEYLVELYISRDDAAGARRLARHARLSANELTRGATATRYLRSVFVPDDETCFLFYEAVSADAVRAAGRVAQLSFDHVAEMVGDFTAEGSTP